MRLLHNGFLLLLFCFAGLTSAMSQSYFIDGIVTDAATGEPIPYASIRIQGTLLGVMTESDGTFLLEAGQMGITLEVSHVSYQKRFIDMDKPPRGVLKVEMKEREYRLDDVVISEGPQRVFKDNTLFVVDYDFWEDELFAIIYDRKARRHKLALVDKRDSIIDVDWGPESPKELVRDCLGNVHAIGTEFACQLFVQDGQISMYQDSLYLYERYVKPCLANVNNFYYYSFSRFNNQILLYYAYDAEREDGVYFVELKDDMKMHQLLDPHPDNPYNQIAQTPEQFLSITPAQWKEVGKINVEFQFQQLAFFYPLHAPLFLIDGLVHIFDHTNGMIRTHTQDGDPVDEIPISYHKEARWEREILVDDVRGDAYTLYARNGYYTLAEIGLESGDIVARTELPRQFPSKVIVRDGVAYFMYKEFNYDDTNRLYRMRIKD